MPHIHRSSLEHRIVEYASDHYPLAADVLAGALGVSAGRVMMELRRMESKGLVELDVLPDRVFVRLLVVVKNESPKGEHGKKEGKGGDDPAYL